MSRRSASNAPFRRSTAFFRDARRLAREGTAIAAVVAVAVFLVYHFTVHTIRNPRPLGGANVLVSRGDTGGSEISFAQTPGHRSTLVGTTEHLTAYVSRDGGASWRSAPGPAVSGRTCAFGWPRALADANGREYVGYLARTFCGDTLRPYLVVSSRQGPHGSWTPPVRVAPKAWAYGFDDAPNLALDSRSGRLYAVWTRSLGAQRETVETSSSGDSGRTWTPAHPVWSQLQSPHLATVAVGADGTVYAAGIDAGIGFWITRSTNGGRTFELPHRVATLYANPAASCGLTGYAVIPTEIKTCTGPNPTLLVDGKHVIVVYDDVGANGTTDVLVSAFDARLRPLFHASVTPPDRGHAEQFFPVAAVDASTGAIWACWYDTTFDPNAHRAWFTCSVSKDARRWTSPERAAAVPSLMSEIQFVAYGGGLYPSVTAGGGVAHAFWADMRRERGSEVYTAALPERAAFGRR